MNLLYQDEQFANLVGLTERAINIPAHIVEKDYYSMLILQAVNDNSVRVLAVRARSGANQGRLRVIPDGAPRLRRAQSELNGS